MSGKIVFEKSQKVSLPYDMRHEDMDKNYGISSLRVWFLLKGPKGAVQFLFSVGCYLPHVEKELAGKPAMLTGDIGNFSGWDVGYHSPEPMYEGQISRDDCEFIPGEKCYYDGSGLRASEWAKTVFSAKGVRPDDLIWTMLEEEYFLRFERDKK